MALERCGADHDPGRPRHRARARPGHRPPRPQAREHLHLQPRRRQRPREDPRLRHRTFALRLAPHQRGRALRHARSTWRPSASRAARRGRASTFTRSGSSSSRWSTGKLPFEANDPTTFLIKHMKEEPPARPRGRAARSPRSSTRSSRQLLEKDPKARPVDAHRVEQDLDRAGGVASHRCRPRSPRPTQPARSRRRRMLPPVGVQQWAKRLQLFEQMLARADGNGAARPAPHAGRRARPVKELSTVRDSSAAEQRKLEEIDARGRDGRQRLGFAVDALGADASKARDDLRAAQAEVEKLGPDVKEAQAAFVAAHADVMSWEGRSGHARALFPARRGLPQVRDARRLVAPRAQARAHGADQGRRQGADGRRHRLPNRCPPHGAGEARAADRPGPRGQPEAPGRPQRGRRAARRAAAAARHAFLRAAAVPSPTWGPCFSSSSRKPARCPGQTRRPCDSPRSLRLARLAPFAILPRPRGLRRSRCVRPAHRSTSRCPPRSTRRAARGQAATTPPPRTPRRSPAERPQAAHARGAAGHPGYRRRGRPHRRRQEARRRSAPGRAARLPRPQAGDARRRDRGGWRLHDRAARARRRPAGQGLGARTTP